MTSPEDVALALRGPILIVGAGLIGASVGKALVAAGADVHLWDIDRGNALVAAGRGAGQLDGLDDDAYRVVVVATPPAAVASTIVERLNRHPHAVVTDTASVKGAVLAELIDLAAGRDVDVTRYVGSHPMAGTQYTGPLTASDELFVDRTWVVTPRTDNRHDDVEQVIALARTCGARVVSMDADEHDRAVAEVSHLPHLMSILWQDRGSVTSREWLVPRPPCGVRSSTPIALRFVVSWKPFVTILTTCCLVWTTRTVWRNSWASGSRGHARSPVSMATR